MIETLNFVLIFYILRLVRSNEFEILILHTNDMHARFDEVNENCNLVLKKDTFNGSLFGGFARLKFALGHAKAEATQKNVPTLFLNAGDTFQGTPFYTLLKEDVVADLISDLNIDAMCFGNHEFDDGANTLQRFLGKINIPIIATNLDFTYEPALRDHPLISRSLTKEIGGRRIGIVGYLTPDTRFESGGGNVTFLDEVESLQHEVRILKEQGVNIIIAVGHSGFAVDQRVAAEISEISLVIGGHTNTFLYSPPDNPPSTEKPVGPYPFMVVQPSGRRVPVVQAYAYTKYLGKLWAKFTSDGTFISGNSSGNAVLLDSSFGKDEDLDAKVQKWKNKFLSGISQIVGRTNVYLDGWRGYCKIEECNLGNLITDAMVDYVSERYNNTMGWTDAPISFVQSGSIRIGSGKTHGNLTYNELLTFLPYRSGISKVRLRGSTLRSALEHSVARYKHLYDKEVANEFLQVSGIHVTYDVARPAGSRVVDVKIRCGNCTVPKYSPLKDDNVYTVITSNFLLNGGNEFKMLQNEALYHEELKADDGSGIGDTDLLAMYIKKIKVVYPEINGRIQILNMNPITKQLQLSSLTSSATCSTSKIAFVFILGLLSRIFYGLRTVAQPVNHESN